MFLLIVIARQIISFPFVFKSGLTKLNILKVTGSGLTAEALATGSGDLDRALSEVIVHGHEQDTSLSTCLFPTRYING